MDGDLDIVGSIPCYPFGAVGKEQSLWIRSIG